jgi:hypothetical protein
VMSLNLIWDCTNTRPALTISSSSARRCLACFTEISSIKPRNRRSRFNLRPLSVSTAIVTGRSSRGVPRRAWSQAWGFDTFEACNPRSRRGWHGLYQAGRHLRADPARTSIKGIRRSLRDGELRAQRAPKQHALVPADVCRSESSHGKALMPNPIAGNPFVKDHILERMRRFAPGCSGTLPPLSCGASTRRQTWNLKKLASVCAVIQAQHSHGSIQRGRSYAHYRSLCCTTFLWDLHTY